MRPTFRVVRGQLSKTVEQPWFNRKAVEVAGRMRDAHPSAATTGYNPEVRNSQNKIVRFGRRRERRHSCCGRLAARIERSALARLRCEMRAARVCVAARVRRRVASGGNKQWRPTVGEAARSRHESLRWPTLSALKACRRRCASLATPPPLLSPPPPPPPPLRRLLLHFDVAVCWLFRPRRRRSKSGDNLEKRKLRSSAAIDIRCSIVFGGGGMKSVFLCSRSRAGLCDKRAKKAPRDRNADGIARKIRS